MVFRLLVLALSYCGLRCVLASSFNVSACCYRIKVLFCRVLTVVLLQSSVVCNANRDGDCKPLLVEYFAASSSRDADKLVMITLNEKGQNRKVAVCHPEHENLQVGFLICLDHQVCNLICLNFPTKTQVLSNALNLLSHVFCRQMGYMTYESRQPASLGMENESALWPASVSCNGTEQRLQDCYWPEVRLAVCKQRLQVQCGSCSKYLAHADDGVISSPGFPSSFPFTVQCDWLIYTKLGEGIELRFTAFNLPTSQLPLSQLGSSTCAAAGAYLEITPDPGTGLAAEERVLANSRRYCVFRAPEVTF